MIVLTERFNIAKTPNEKTMLQRQIEFTDHEIDNHVYTLYDLTPEEIQIVEGNL